MQPISLASDIAGTPIQLPKGAQNIALAPGGTTAWVVCLNSNKLVPIDLLTHRKGAAITVRGGPFAVAVADQPRGPAPPTTAAPSKPKKPKKGKATS